MDSLVRLCRLLSDTAFVDVDGGSDDGVKPALPRSSIMCSSTARQQSPFLGRFCWLVSSFVNDVLDKSASTTSSSLSRRYTQVQMRCLQDFFVMTMEQFLGKYADQLANLPFDQRRLVIAVKYRLACTLEKQCPAGVAAAATTSDNHHDYGFARCFFTVASLVPCTNDDYRTLQTTNLYACTCKKASTGTTTTGLCQFCIRSSTFNGVVGGGSSKESAHQLAARVPDNPYDPPNPFTWVKLHQDRDDNGGGGGESLFHRFRRQRIQKDVTAVWKRIRGCRSITTTAATRDTSHDQSVVRKFRASSLPYLLKRKRVDEDVDGEAVDEVIDLPDKSGRYERDLGTLLSHFTINLGKLFYLEPSIVPQFSDDSSSK